MAEAPRVVAYTADVSICSQIARLALAEHGITPEHVHVDIEGRMENYDPSFIRIQPAMTVPAMKYTAADGEETIVGDSKDILYFLAERHPGLYPEGQRAAIDEYINGFYERFMLVGGFTFAHLVRKGAAVKEFIRVGKVEVTRAKLEKVIAEEPELREVAQAKLEQKMGRNMIEWAEGQETAPLVGAVGQVLSTMEEGLATGHAFLLGESYTLADVVATAFCGRAAFIKGDELFGPHVLAYWERMKARPSFKAAVVIAEWEESLMYKQIEAIGRGEDGLALDVDWASGARI